MNRWNDDDDDHTPADDDDGTDLLWAAIVAAALMAGAGVRGAYRDSRPSTLSAQPTAPGWPAMPEDRS